MLKITRRAAVAALAMLTVGVSAPAHAQDWKPEQPIRIIVPWAAGGATDSIIRFMAGELQKEMGANFVVVNQTGATGTVGTKGALDAPRDGYT